MKPTNCAVTVPWSGLADYQCFGCSPHNASGLRLQFTAHPEGLQTRFRLGRLFESYPGVVHGGLIGVVADETMGNLIVCRQGMSAFTVSMRIRYVAPLASDQEYVCLARLHPERGQADLLHASADILDSSSTEMASATATYRPVTIARARQHMIMNDDDARVLEQRLSTMNHPKGS
jgi:acyl-coenzyme A thioesterase PaaI-like protein